MSKRDEWYKTADTNEGRLTNENRNYQIRAKQETQQEYTCDNVIVSVQIFVLETSTETSSENSFCSVLGVYV